MTQLTSNSSPDDLPVIDGSLIIWRCDGNICTWRGDHVEQLDQGPCGAPDIDQGQSAWICRDRVTLYDGSELHQLTDEAEYSDSSDRDGAPRPRSILSRNSVRIHSGRLVWLEFPEYSAMDTGQLKLYGGEQILDLADVNLPCLYCAMLQQPISLSLSSEVVAWSYAIVWSSANHYSTGNIAWPGPLRHRSIAC